MRLLHLPQVQNMTYIARLHDHTRREMYHRTSKRLCKGNYRLCIGIIEHIYVLGALPEIFTSNVREANGPFKERVKVPSWPEPISVNADRS